jgi:hypothetical protein
MFTDVILNIYPYTSNISSVKNVLEMCPVFLLSPTGHGLDNIIKYEKRIDVLEASAVNWS